MLKETKHVCFSVLILHWRSEHVLTECMNALKAQTIKDFEVLLLDNGNNLPLPDGFASDFADLDLRILRSDINLGFAAGNNSLAGYAKGKYLALLNADAFPKPDWLEKIHIASNSYPDTYFASRLLKANEPELLDGEWHVYHVSGLAWRHNHNQPLSLASNEPKEVFGACAAASVYPREAYEVVGGFDEDFFAYMEDIDLDFRLQLAGYSCLYLPDAVVRHVGSASSAPRSDFTVYNGHRNLPWVFIKNMPGWLFWLLLPFHILVNLAYMLIAVFMGKGRIMAKAKWDALKGLKSVIEKRRAIQKNRKASIRRIATMLNWNPFAPLVKRKF
jgi:GT2 family glycosyltransferase